MRGRQQPSDLPLESALNWDCLVESLQCTSWDLLPFTVLGNIERSESGRATVPPQQVAYPYPYPYLCLGCVRRLGFGETAEQTTFLGLLRLRDTTRHDKKRQTRGGVRYCEYEQRQENKENNGEDRTPTDSTTGTEACAWRCTWVTLVFRLLVGATSARPTTQNSSGCMERCGLFFAERSQTQRGGANRGVVRRVFGAHTGARNTLSWRGVPTLECR